MSRAVVQNDNYNFVLYVPEISHHAFRVTETGRVVLGFEINIFKRMMAKLVHREAVSDLELDDLSTSAWLGIDGRRSILDIACIQCGHTGDDIDEAVARIVKFMRYVARRGWIRFKEVKQA